MRLNGLGAPDATPLVTLNAVDAAPRELQRQPNERGNCFHCGNYGHYKAQCRKLRKERYYEIKTQNGVPNTAEQTKPKCDTCGKPIKQKTAGTELMRQTTLETGDTSLPYPQTRLATSRSQPLKSSQKTKNAATTLWGNGRHEGIHSRRPPKAL